MAEFSTPPSDALQQELAQLRHRVTQLEQQLAGTQTDRGAAEKHDRNPADRQQSASVWQQLFEHSADAMVLLDLSQGIFTDFNQAAVRMIGFPSKEDLIGKTPLAISPEQQQDGRFSAEKAIEMIANAVEQGSHRFEWLIQRFDGTVLWIEIVLTLISFNDHATLLCAWRDINDYKQAEAALESSRRFLHRVLDTLPNQHIFWKDRNLIYLGCNQLGAEVAGVGQPQAIIGKTDYDLAWTTQEADFFRQCDRRVMESNQAELGIIEPQLQADGKQAWLETSKVPLHDAEGNVIGILVAFQDVTQQEQLLHDRQRAAAQLRSQEQFLRSIYDGVDCFIFVVEVQENGNFIYVSYNKATEKLTGLKNADIAGKTPVARFGQAEGTVVQQGFQECVDSGTPVTREECITFGARSAWFLTTLNPIRSQEGRIDRIVGTAFDVTALKQAQTQLQQQATDLEAALQELQRTQFQMAQAEKMSSLGQLVAGVAHEINNPVNFIFGNLSHANAYTQDLLNLLKLYRQHYPNPDREVQEEAEAIDLEFLVEDLPKLLNSMKVGADRIQKIVASLRTFSRMDEAEMKSVNIHEGIDSTLMILQNRIRARSDRPEIQIVKTYGDLPLVECYAGQLNQVFMNLLSNAIDALEEARSPVPKLTIETQITHNNQLQVSIADNGIGIPETVQSRLFDPFFTTKPVGKGTGMGLSISYQIVTEKHNGSLECISQPGAGASFVITIPLRVAEL